MVIVTPSLQACDGVRMADVLPLVIAQSDSHGGRGLAGGVRAPSSLLTRGEWGDGAARSGSSITVHEDRQSYCTVLLLASSSSVLVKFALD